jgi:glycosyltransferase involved in cell wall biosynthesis
MISSRGKGHARTELHAVKALAARGEHELIVFVREDVEIAGAEVVRVLPRPTLDWELRGVVLESRRRRLDAFLTLSDRLPIVGGPPFVVWLFESPVHRMRLNREHHAPLRHRASDVVTAGLWKRSLGRAAHLAFGSQATRDEVLAQVRGVAASSVVYPGLAPGFESGPSTEEGAYVLHLGSNDPRDNTSTAVEAARRAGVRLRVVGGWSGEGAEALGRVSDERLVELYRGAAAFLDPTLYEGFGYGVLEAMACGAPVVASNATSIPEVVGDAALLCDPRDADALAHALRRVLDDPRLADELRQRGFEQAGRFTWRRAAEGLAAAIDEALRESSAASRHTTPA